MISIIISYIVPPGTSGIRAQTINDVTGVFIFRASTSAMTVNETAAQKLASRSVSSIARQHSYTNPPIAPFSPAKNSLRFCLMLNSTPNPRLARKEPNEPIKISCIAYLHMYKINPAPIAMAVAHKNASAPLASPEM